MSSTNLDKDDLGASAKRGLLYITAAKLWFMMAGLLVQFLLPRALGSPALFGVWTLVAAWVSTPNNVVVTATIQAVSFFAAKGAAATEQAKATALRMQVAVGGGAALLFLVLAPIIANFEHDAELTAYLRLASGIVLCYSFYAVFVGAANGARQFHKQAGLDMAFSTLRALLVVGGAWIFHAILASVAGWVLAAAIILVVSIAVVGLPKKGAAAAAGNALSVGTMLRFSAWILVYLSAINLLMFVDGFWLKRLCTESYSGLGPAGAKRTVDALVGVYGAAQTVARLPYQLILAGAFVIFPVMSRAALEKDQQRTRGYITTTLRYSLIATCALALSLGIRPEASMRLLYPAEYATGASALQVLLLSYVCFSLLTIAGTLTNGMGRTRPTTAMGLVAVVLTNLTIPAAIGAALRAGQQPLRAAATGLACGMVLGLALFLVYLWRTFRASFPPLTVVRVAIASGVVLLLGRAWPAAGTGGLLGSKLGTILCAGLAPLGYLAVLFASRELSLAELRSLRNRS